MISGDFGKFVDKTKKTEIMIISSSLWGKNQELKPGQKQCVVNDQI